MKTENLKQACIKFFYWWWNEKGNNTAEGFDKWIQTEEGKEAASQFEGSEPSTAEKWTQIHDKLPGIGVEVLLRGERSDENGDNFEITHWKPFSQNEKHIIEALQLIHRNLSELSKVNRTVRDEANLQIAIEALEIYANQFKAVSQETSPDPFDGSAELTTPAQAIR